REIGESDVAQEAESLDDLLQDQTRDHLLLRLELEAREELVRLGDRERSHLRDRSPGDAHVLRLRLEPPALAVLAGELALVALELLAPEVRLRLPVAAIEQREDALERALHLAASTERDLDLGLAGP